MHSLNTNNNPTTVSAVKQSLGHNEHAWVTLTHTSYQIVRF